MGSVVVVVITAAAASVVRFLVASALCLLVPVMGLSHSALCLALALSVYVSRLSLPLFVFDRFKLLFGFNCMGLPFEFAPSLKSF